VAPRFSIIEIMMRLLIAFILLAGALVAGPATARQDDPRLDALFDRLASADDEETASRIENLIWKIWIETGDKTLDRLMLRGILAIRTHQYDVAVESFTRIIEAAPNFAEGWNKRATVYFLMGRYDESIRDVQKTLALEPRHFGALAGMGLILSELGDKAGALDWFARALAINPHMPAIRDLVRKIKTEIGDDQI